MKAAVKFMGVDLPGKVTVQANGETRPRVFTGTGRITGPEAYERFKDLARLFGKNPGELETPAHGKTTAYFVGLRLSNPPGESKVSYSFEFWETR